MVPWPLGVPRRVRQRIGRYLARSVQAPLALVIRNLIMDFLVLPFRIWDTSYRPIVPAPAVPGKCFYSDHYKLAERKDLPELHRKVKVPDDLQLTAHKRLGAGEMASVHCEPIGAVDL
jgi:hypothetical protein